MHNDLIARRKRFRDLCFRYNFPSSVIEAKNAYKDIIEMYNNEPDCEEKLSMKRSIDSFKRPQCYTMSVKLG